MLYLLIMLLIIFTCKLIIDSDIQLNKIKEYPLGNIIHKILVLYISVWKSSANIWIYMIVSGLIIFTLVSTYSTYSILTILT